MAYLIFTKYHRAERGIESHTLLGQFIKEKLGRYIEPERKGTAKGDEIGFSRKKYEASLYNITDLKIKYVSRILNISYGLLRKWRTEDNFKEMVERHSQEFAARFCAYIETFVKEKRRSEETGKCHGKEEYDELYAAVTDGHAYGPQLCKAIAAILENRVAEIEKRKKGGGAGRSDDIFLQVVEGVIIGSNIHLNSKKKFFVQVNKKHAQMQEEQLRAAKERGATIIGNPLELVQKVLDFEQLSDTEMEQAIDLFQYLLKRVQEE